MVVVSVLRGVLGGSVDSVEMNGCIVLRVVKLLRRREVSAKHW